MASLDDVIVVMGEGEAGGETASPLSLRLPLLPGGGPPPRHSFSSRILQGIMFVKPYKVKKQCSRRLLILEEL